MTTNPSERAVDDLDRAFDDLLRGRPTQGVPAELVAFTEAVREIAAAPTRPSPGLAELLVNGRLTDPVRVQPGQPRRRRRTMLIIEGFAAFMAKCAAAGAVTQSAAGVGIALVCVTGAGTAGVLPGPIQDGVATAVETVTPWNLPDSADGEVTTQVDTVADDGSTGPNTSTDTTTVVVEEPTPTGIPVATPVDNDRESDDSNEDGDEDADDLDATKDEDGDDKNHDSGFGQSVRGQAHYEDEDDHRGNGDNNISVQAREWHGPQRTESSDDRSGSSHDD